MNGTIGILIPLLMLLGCSPSDEMVELRHIEKSLGIPDSSARSENDRGCYVDRKGAPQYEHSIFNHYRDLQSINQTQKSLMKNDWMLSERHDYEENHYYYYTKQGINVRIQVAVDLIPGNSHPYAVNLYYIRKEACQR